MKILTVVVNLDKGGTQRAAQNFAEEYLRLGHDSRVWALSAGGVRHAELQAAGVRCWIGCDASQLAEISRWQPDLIHLHTVMLEEAVIRSLINCCPSARLVETNVFSVPTPWVDEVDVSFQLSEWCDYLYRQRCERHAFSAVVPYPVICERFHRADAQAIRDFRQRYRLPENAFVVGRIGQAYDRKWSPLLIDAFESLCQSGRPAHLLLVNPPESIVTLCRKSVASSNIVIIDTITSDDDLRAAYSSMDVFAHVADQGESFGLVLAESLLCETPVVTMSTPWEDNSQAEVVGNMVGGLVATTRRGFFAALQVLHDDAALRRQLGSRGREHIINTYDARSIASLAVEKASDQHVATKSGATSRSRLLEIYRGAFDTPSVLSCVFLGRFPRLHLSRYLSGYEPWTMLGRRACRSISRKLGTAPVHGADST